MVNNSPPVKIKIKPCISILLTNAFIPINENHPMNRYKNTSKYGKISIFLTFRTSPKIDSDQIIQKIVKPIESYKLISAIGVYVPAIRK